MTEQPAVGSLASEPDTATHQQVRVVIGSNGLLVFIQVQVAGRSEAEIGMTGEEALQVAAALQLHSAKVLSLTSQKPNA